MSYVLSIIFNAFDFGVFFQTKDGTNCPAAEALKSVVIVAFSSYPKILYTDLASRANRTILSLGVNIKEDSSVLNFLQASMFGKHLVSRYDLILANHILKSFSVTAGEVEF